MPTPDRPRQERRREALEEIRHSARMVEGCADDDGRGLQDAWTRGELLADELAWA